MKALPPTNDWHRNVLVLPIVFAFLLIGFAAAPQNAQTKRGAKATPTPAKKKTVAKAAATPQKTPAKTAAKKTDPKKEDRAKAKPVAQKTDKKQTERDARQTKSKAAAKPPSKTDAKTAAKRKETDKKSKETPAKQTAKTRADKTREREKPAVSKTAARDTRKPPKVEAASKTPVKRTPVKAEMTEIIATVPGVSVRSLANASAPEVSRVRLGQVLKVSDKNPAWYKVQYANGARTSTGWVSANSVNAYNSAEQDEIYRRIVERNYRPDGMDFVTAAEVYEFLTEKSADQALSGDIELKRLLALRAALKRIAVGGSQPTAQKSFLKKYDESIVYSEPGGVWLVRSNLFWNLHAKYKSQPIAEQIAWEAAQNPLPGECEGYVNCYLFYARMTTGEYLNLHPSGKNAAAALSLLTDSLEPIAASLSDKSGGYTGPSDVTDRAEFNNLIAELRTIVSRLPFTEKEKPLRQLKQIAEGFR